MQDDRPLLTYMTERGLSDEDVARGLKLDRKTAADTIRLIKHAYRRASWILCFAIEEYTAGKVAAKALRNQPLFGKRQARRARRTAA